MSERVVKFYYQKAPNKQLVLCREATAQHSSWGTPTGFLDVARPECRVAVQDLPPATAVAAGLESASPGPLIWGPASSLQMHMTVCGPLFRKARWLVHALFLLYGVGLMVFFQ